MRRGPTRSWTRGAAAALGALVLGAAAGCSTDMRDADLSARWTHASACEMVRAAVESARARGPGGLGGPLTPRAAGDLTRPGALANATVRLESMTWPAPGSGLAMPFLLMSRGQALAGVVNLLTLQWVYGFAADLLIFFPFGYSHRAVIVEIPAAGMPAIGNGYFISEEGTGVIFYDDDDRWFWRANRIDDIAEALEFLAREQRGPLGPDRRRPRRGRVARHQRRAALRHLSEASARTARSAAAASRGTVRPR